MSVLPPLGELGSGAQLELVLEKLVPNWKQGNWHHHVAKLLSFLMGYN